MQRILVLVAAVAGALAFLPQGAHAQQALTGNWSGPVETRPGGGRTSMSVFLDRPQDGTSDGFVRFGAPQTCRIDLKFLTVDSDARIFKVVGTSPSGFCKGYRFGDFSARPAAEGCSIDVTLAPHPSLTGPEGTRTVRASLPCHNSP